MIHTNLPPRVQEQWKEPSSPADKPEVHVKQENDPFTETSVSQSCNKLPILENQLRAAAVADNQIPPLRAMYQDISSDEKDNFSSPNEARPLSYMVSILVIHPVVSCCLEKAIFYKKCHVRSKESILIYVLCRMHIIIMCHVIVKNTISTGEMPCP